MQLSKDRNLEEREQLQLQLSDVNYKMQQQQETIQVTSTFIFKNKLFSKVLHLHLIAKIVVIMRDHDFI